MVNILFCGNGYVFDGMLTCALSILKRSDSREPYTFYVYTMDVSHLKPAYTPIPDSMIGFFDSVIKSYNPENRVVKTDVTKLYMEHFSGCPNEGAYCSPYTLIRLFADLVDGMPDKLLYLDADIMFNRDIHLLYDVDVDGVEYAAARDHYGKYLIRPDYVNAGVLLFNLKKMKETERILKTIREQEERESLRDICLSVTVLEDTDPKPVSEAVSRYIEEDGKALLLSVGERLIFARSRDVEIDMNELIRRVARGGGRPDMASGAGIPQCAEVARKILVTEGKSRSWRKKQKGL